MCGICGKGKNTYLCKKCENKLKTEAVLGQDKYRETYFENHFYLFQYQGNLRKLMLQYKFNEKPYLYKSFTAFFNKYQKNYLQMNFYDIIIPVPISKKRFQIRGYNQSLLIAKEIAKMHHKKLEADVLIKIQNNSPQSTLNKQEREKNAKNVYKIRNTEKIKNKKILLIDDIFTTGATVNECSKILKQGQAKKVDILTIAKD